MALVVEDGTGKVDAESYCSVAQADAYHSVRAAGETWTDLELSEKERCLREATDYLTYTYTGSWSGCRFTDEQALDWPRIDVAWQDSASGYRPNKTIPSELVKATAELAMRANSGPLVVDLGRETASESVDVISVTYAKGGTRQVQYDLVDSWLQSLLDGSGSDSVKVSRA